MERNVRKPIGRQMGLVAGDGIVKGACGDCEIPESQGKSPDDISGSPISSMKQVQAHHWPTMTSPAKRKVGY